MQEVLKDAESYGSYDKEAVFLMKFLISIVMKCFSSAVDSGSFTANCQALNISPILQEPRGVFMIERAPSSLTCFQ